MRGPGRPAAEVLVPEDGILRRVTGEEIDVSSLPLPYTATGTFPYEGQPGGSCDGTASNMVWFKYTPTQTDYYEVSVQSADGTADLRVAVFETDACNPYGTELPSAVPYLHGGISRNLAALPGGLDDLYIVAKKRTPNQTLPHKDIFMQADAEKFGPIVKKAILPIVNKLSTILTA